MRTQIVVCAQKEYIDPSVEIYILVEPYLYRASIRETLDDRYEIIHHPLYDEKKFREANRYIVDLTERMIASYGEALNNLHSISLNKRQWTIILCIWLKGTLFDLFYKYSKLNFVKERKPEVIAPSYYNMEDRTALYIKNGMISEEKNAFIWGYIAEKIGLNVRYVDVQSETKSNRKNNRIRKVINNSEKLFRELNYLVTRKVVNNLGEGVSIALFDTLLPDVIRQRIISKSGGKVGYLDPSQFHYESSKIINKFHKNTSWRHTVLDGRFSSNDEFEKIAFEFIEEFIPVAYFEAFHELYDRSYQITKNWAINRIYTVCACVELMDVCAAIQKNKGTKICEIQHSVGYAAYDTYTIEESMYADEYLTWGWNKRQFSYLSAGIRPIAITRFPNKVLDKSPEKLRILMTCNYVIESEEGHGWYFGNYIDNEMRFVDNLSDELRRYLVLRIDLHDPSNMEFLYRAKEKYPYIQYEDRYEIPLYKSLEDTTFIVCDYYSSTHVESALMGKPFVMFDASENIAKTDFIKEELHNLQNVDVYADTGEKMAEILNSKNDLVEWLHSDSVREAYRKYLNACIGTGKSIADGGAEEVENLWYYEFMR